jgi:hypothetical protein
MKHVETRISETTVRMRYADDPDPVKVTHWLDFRVALNDLQVPDQNGMHALGDLERRYLASIRLGALRYARGVIDDEIRALAG